MSRCVVLIAASSLNAQAASAPASRPTDALGAQLDWQLANRDLTLPTIPAVESIDSGRGAPVLLTRGADGQLAFVALDRPALRSPLPTSRPTESSAASLPKRRGPISVALRPTVDRAGGVDVSIGSRLLSRGAVIDQDALHAAFERPPTRVFLLPEREIELAQVLTVAAAAHRASAEVSFGGGFSSDPESTDVAVVKSMPSVLGWQPDGAGVYRHEVLLCFDASEPFGKVALLLQELAHMGVWRVGFVGIDADGGYTMIPFPLATDPADPR